MAQQRVDEVLDKAIIDDIEIIPRYKITKEDGTIIDNNATIELTNPVLVEGMPQNKTAWDEILAASGITSGTATALTLSQPGFTLQDGALIRFKLHINSGATPTINVNSTGAKAIMQDATKPMKAGIAAGTWLTAVYSSTLGFFVLQGSSGGALAYPGTLSHSPTFDGVMGYLGAKRNI